MIAALCGNPRMARQVGWALHTAPVGLPWHRVVNRQGGLYKGFSMEGAREQRRLLELEGVEVREDFTIKLDKYLWGAGK